MSLREPTSGNGHATRRREDERRRLSVFHLVGLAAGGVIGSGWIFGAADLYGKAGDKAWLAWLIGGLLMLLIGWVMVELGTAAPRTGGLIFLPLQSSGPLVATIVAAGVWIFYAINLASEAIMMTNGLAGGRFHLLHAVPVTSARGTLTASGWLATLGFMVGISALNLVVPRVFFRINSWLTVVKIAILVGTVGLLLWMYFASVGPVHGPPGDPVPTAGAGSWGEALTAVINGGVIFAYIGFQGPLDLAGNIKREGIGESARLRRAVFGTLIGSVLLYIAFQFTFALFHGDVSTGNPESPYAQIAYLYNAQFGRVLLIAGVLAPMGAGLVFTHALTREVAALGRAHLTHRGLQTARRASLGGRYGIYWLVLLVDLLVATALLGVARGNWKTLVAITGIVALIVYAMTGVVLVALGDRSRVHSDRRRTVQKWLARLSFVMIGLVLHLAGWAGVWRGLATLTAGSALLLGLPLLSLWRPGFGRFYDAKEHVTLLRKWREHAAARAALVLVGYLAALALLTLWSTFCGTAMRFLPGTLVALCAAAAFEALVGASKQYMGKAGTTAAVGASHEEQVPVGVGGGSTTVGRT